MKSSYTHRITCLVGLFWVLGWVSAIAQGISFSSDAPIDGLLKRAEAEDKLLFVYFYADWCAGCPQMESQAFQDDAVTQLYRKAFVSARYDQQSEMGKRIADRYEVKASPSFLFIDPVTKKVVHRVVGILGNDLMLEVAHTAQHPDRNLLAYMERYAAGKRDPQFLYDFGYMLKQAQLTRHYLDLPDEYLSTQAQWNTPDNMQFILDFTDRPNMKSFELLTQHREVFYDRYSRSSIDQKINDIVSYRLTELKSLRQVALQEEIFDKVHDLLTVAFPDEAEARTYEFKMSYFKENTDREGYAQAAIDYVNYMGKDISPTKLRDMAFQFYNYIEDKDLLKHAYKWSKRALRAEKSVPNYDAICSVSYKLDRKLATRWYLRQGIRYAKLNDESYDTLAEIQRWSRDSQ